MLTTLPKSALPLLPCLAVACFATPSRAAVIAFEFGTPGNTEGWIASSTPAAALVTGFKQALGIDGLSGVLTADDVDVDPQILRTGAGNLITLPAGERWSTFETRFRQLSGNPGAAGTAGAPYAGSGTILFFNNTTTNLGNTALATKTVTGTGAYATDTYTMTLTADPAGGEWQLLTVSFASAPVLGSQNFSAIRLDPLGNAASRNFEIDFIRVTSVPEAGSGGLTLLALGAALARRRR